MFKTSSFKPAWWLSNAHLQTIAPKYIRKQSLLNSISESISLPDGDSLELIWTETPQSNTTKPIIIVLHGLEGSINSHYAKGMMVSIKQHGWIGALMHFRGCNGKTNNKAYSYHSGETRDISYLHQLLKERYPNTLMAAIGFSLGGNVLSRYLAEHPDNALSSATIICAPLHLASCSERINRGFSKVYQRYLINMLKTSTIAKIKKNLLPNHQPARINAIKTMYDFDNQVTAPINGFSSADDYYQQSSGKFILHKITTPTLVIHAKDDPFLAHNEIIKLSHLPSNIHFEISNKGGHVGFVTGRNPFKPQYWLEQRVPEFIQQQLGK